MANLAVQGHATRGNEVIDLLEMLGGENRFQREGNNKDRFYYIDKNRHIQTTCGALSYTLFDLEQFEKEFPYKVGDKVLSHNKWEGIIIGMEWSNDDIVYHIRENTGYISHQSVNELQPYKEETMEEINISRIGFNGDKARLILSDGYEFKVEDDEFFVIKKKPKYPKNFEECCDILCVPNDKQYVEVDNPVFPNKLIESFTKLLICRNAYWKIIGEELDLDKPWEPKFGKYIHYSINFYLYKDGFVLHKREYYSSDNLILVFPTEEMRDAFYDNFSDLIEKCKELL